MTFLKSAPAACLDLRRGRQFQAEDRLQLVDRPHPGLAAIAVRLVHEQHKVVELGQVLEVALADVFLQPLDAGLRSAAHFGVDLGDVEDVDVDRRVRVFEAWNRWLDQPLGPNAAPALVVVAGDDLRRLMAKSASPWKTYFGVFGVKSAMSLL